MRSIQFIILATLLGGIVAACGKDSNQQSAVDGNYSYQFVSDDCDTGRHWFNSLTELCQGLRGTALNNECAADLRGQYYKEKGCPGTFTETP